MASQRSLSDAERKLLEQVAAGQIAYYYPTRGASYYLDGDRKKVTAAVKRLRAKGLTMSGQPGKSVFHPRPEVLTNAGREALDA